MLPWAAIILISVSRGNYRQPPVSCLCWTFSHVPVKSPLSPFTVLFRFQSSFTAVWISCLAFGFFPVLFSMKGAARDEKGEWIWVVHLSSSQRCLHALAPSSHHSFSTEVSFFHVPILASCPSPSTLKMANMATLVLPENHVFPTPLTVSTPVNVLLWFALYTLAGHGLIPKLVWGVASKLDYMCLGYIHILRSLK